MAVNNECWIILFHGSTRDDSEYLPLYPDEVSDTQQAIWSTQTILGRSSPLAVFSNTDARQVSFNMLLHREMDNGDQTVINHILKMLRAALYPRYVNSGLMPPIIRVVLGELAIEGVLTSLTYNWKKPIIDKKYMICDVSVTIVGYLSSVTNEYVIRFANEPSNPLGVDTSPLDGGPEGNG